MRWKTSTLPLHPHPCSWGMLISGRTLEGQPDQRKGDSGLIELPASLIIPDFDQWSAVDRKRPQANAPGCHRDLFKSQDLETPRCPRALLLKGIYCYLCGNAPALFDDIDTLWNRFSKEHRLNRLELDCCSVLLHSCCRIVQVYIAGI
ncbi:uncharacterized protein CDAR_12101 [Caerostris darwini]|uniref:Uncharacterized protein n=1 Tax=Caerostris darwini TaxID=1538125 RepID=A0AAV4M4L5_9ARAC|nr:uncharacterized protein CDAR_12101 [Caerostris darwini]